MLKVAMLSAWHVHAGDYAKQVGEFDDVEITVVWDEQPERGRKWAKELGVAFEEDLDTLLKRDDVDAVIVNTPTSMHTEVMVAAANAGKHIFTEKVMALTVEDCNKIADAVNKAGVKFCISFPHRIMPANLFAKKAVDEGLLGAITLLRVRNAHNGATANWLPEYFYDETATGGGAMIDLGAHPMYLSRWLLGRPKNVSSTFNSFTDKPVEDNAVSVIEFENKAIAVVETGFVTAASPFTMELYGTEGSLFIGGPDNNVKINSKKYAPDSDGFVIPRPLPEALPSAMEQWVNSVLYGDEIYFGLEEGIQLTELMEAAYESQKERRKVDF